MAADNTILLNVNGVDIKNPSTLTYDYYSLSKSGRLASGKMTMDIIAHKRKFECAYTNMSTTEWNTMMAAVFDANTPFYTLHYYKDNVWTDCTVYTGDISKDLARWGGQWYYTNIKIDFIEQ